MALVQLFKFLLVYVNVIYHKLYIPRFYPGVYLNWGNQLFKIILSRMWNETLIWELYVKYVEYLTLVNMLEAVYSFQQGFKLSVDNYKLFLACFHCLRNLKNDAEDLGVICQVCGIFNIGKYVGGCL